MSINSLLTIPRWLSLLDPVDKFMEEVVEEVTIGYRKHLVRYHHKQAASIAIGYTQSVGDVYAQVIRCRHRVNFNGFVRIVRQVYLVVDLQTATLDRFHFDVVWGKLSWAYLKQNASRF